MADFNLFSEGRSPQVPLRPESGGAKLPLCPDLTIGEGNEAGVRAPRRIKAHVLMEVGAARQRPLYLGGGVARMRSTIKIDLENRV